MLASAHLVAARLVILAQLAAATDIQGSAALTADDACSAGSADGQAACAFNALQQHGTARGLILEAKETGTARSGTSRTDHAARPSGTRTSNVSDECAAGVIFVAPRRRQRASLPARESLGRIYPREGIHEYFYADFDTFGYTVREKAASEHPAAKLMVVEVFDRAGFMNASFTPAELALFNAPGETVYFTAGDFPNDPAYQLVEYPGGCDNPTAAMPYPGAGKLGQWLLDGQAMVRHRTSSQARPGTASEDLLHKADSGTAWIYFNPPRAAIDEPAIDVAYGAQADDLVFVQSMLGSNECYNDQFWSNVAKMAGCDP